MTDAEAAAGSIPASVAAAWGVRERPHKGPRPGLSLGRIVDAAVRVADAEGLDAVSMSRVAAELGTAPMSLYRPGGRPRSRADRSRARAGGPGCPAGPGRCGPGPGVIRG